jgi:histone H3/H4
MQDAWRRCTTCKNPIPFESPYFACSVSTCNHKRVGLFFCSVPCWDAHVPGARHRDAWAIEQTAPTREAWERAEREAAADAVKTARSAPDAEVPRRRVVPEPARRSDDPDGAVASRQVAEQDVLVVVSKLKKYVRDYSGMNTSDNVLGVLSDHLRVLSREAIRVAGADGRKTVMNRDFATVIERKWRS